MSMIGDVLFSRTQQQVLGLLYGHPKRSFFTNEIVRHAGIGVGTVRRELERMAKAGLLSLTTVGNQKHYQANPACPVYAELLGIVRKSFGLADRLAEALSPLAERIRFALVYGSLAKGEERPESDIDLMLVGDELGYGEVMSLMAPLEAELKRPINPTLYSQADFVQRREERQSFLIRILEQPKIMVKGSEDDIEGI
ncbi:MAG: transcriptional regulator [Gammaproteobacteria bacterium]|nr:MAG: transcriptional regulator [Gammaproteobacteria bacterium]